MIDRDAQYIAIAGLANAGFTPGMEREAAMRWASGIQCLLEPLRLDLLSLRILARMSRSHRCRAGASALARLAARS